MTGPRPSILDEAIRRARAPADGSSVAPPHQPSAAEQEDRHAMFEVRPSHMTHQEGTQRALPPRDPVNGRFTTGRGQSVVRFRDGKPRR